MKQISFFLGLVVSASSALSLMHYHGSEFSRSSRFPFSSADSEVQLDVQLAYSYTGTNEDGDQEEVSTDR